MNRKMRLNSGWPDLWPFQLRKSDSSIYVLLLVNSSSDWPKSEKSVGVAVGVPVGVGPHERNFVVVLSNWLNWCGNADGVVGGVGNRRGGNIRTLVQMFELSCILWGRESHRWCKISSLHQTWTQRKFSLTQISSKLLVSGSWCHLGGVRMIT